MAFHGAIPDGGPGGYAVTTMPAPPPPAVPPPPPPPPVPPAAKPPESIGGVSVAQAVAIVASYAALPPAPPSIQSELPLPGGQGQIAGVFFPTSPAAAGGGSSGGAGTSSAGTSGDDLAAALAAWNAQPGDESPLPEWFLADPFGIQLLSTDGLPLKGQAALEAIIAACDLYGIEAKAACADGLHEGFNGGIGDTGSAFGPWQEHLLDGRIASFAGKPLYSPTVQAWAWSPNGIAHGVRGMAVDTPSARGKHGHAAVYAIVYGFERPADKPGAYKTRAAEYDHLVALGDGWKAYVASKLTGPALGTSANIGGVPVAGVAPASPTGAAAAFREVTHLLAAQIPNAGRKASAVASRVA